MVDPDIALVLGVAVEVQCIRSTVAWNESHITLYSQPGLWAA